MTLKVIQAAFTVALKLIRCAQVLAIRWSLSGSIAVRQSPSVMQVRGYMHREGSE